MMPPKEMKPEKITTEEPESAVQKNCKHADSMGNGNAELQEILQKLADLLTAQNATLSTAESCTGGGIGHAITAVNGSSAWFTGGIISYSNDIKHRVLGVPEAIFATHGAVSEACVRAMALGAQKVCQSTWSVAVSGIAGPTGGTAEKPVGTVWIAWQGKNIAKAECFHFLGSREAVRNQTICTALQRLYFFAQITK